MTDKKNYQSPSLITYGDMSDLTQELMNGSKQDVPIGHAPQANHLS